MSEDLYICPACGSEVKVGSSRCPGCDPPKPWEQDGYLDGIDIGSAEDDDFDYERFTANEFGSGSRPHGSGALWVLTAVLLLLALAAARFFF